MIVIPMAGLSSRFFRAGYEVPKYMLQLGGVSLFDCSVLSFESYFESHQFLFIVRDVCSTVDYVKSRCVALGVKDFEIVVLNKETKGQAETIFLGTSSVVGDCPITIFNIDTFRPNFSFPNLLNLGDGYLEVFQGDGDNWSYAKPYESTSTKVAETAEKNPISNLCSTGLYHFADMSSFRYAYGLASSREESEWEKGELYVAPLYNYLIRQGKEIHYNLIDRSDVVFCGTPDEYEALLHRF